MDYLTCTPSSPILPHFILPSSWSDLSNSQHSLHNHYTERERDREIHRHRDTERDRETTDWHGESTEQKSFFPPPCSQRFLANRWLSVGPALLRKAFSIVSLCTSDMGGFLPELQMSASYCIAGVQVTEAAAEFLRKIIQKHSHGIYMWPIFLGWGYAEQRPSLSFSFLLASRKYQTSKAGSNLLAEIKYWG